MFSQSFALPGATTNEIKTVDLPIDSPNEVCSGFTTNSEWVAQASTYKHVDNGNNKTNEYVVKVPVNTAQVPPDLKGIFSECIRYGYVYVLFKSVRDRIR